MSIARNLGIIAVALGLGNAPVFADTAGKAVQDLKTKAYDLLDKDVTTIKFGNGVSTLTANERGQLKAVVDAVRDDTKVDRVIVAAWADEELPSGKDAQLSQAARDLADLRAKNVKAVLGELGVDKVDVYSMADQPGWIAKAFNTNEAQVKGEGKVADANDEAAAKLGKLLRDKGGPSTAVVVVKRVGELAAH
jgi:hypothetical protein